MLRLIMVKSFRHKGLEAFYKTGSKAGIQPKHARDLEELLALLDAITCHMDINLPGLNLHKLSGNLQGFYSIKVNANWRLIFQFEGEDIILVDYIDYH
jgi:proteic killer suppression protein